MQRSWRQLSLGRRFLLGGVLLALPLVALATAAWLGAARPAARSGAFVVCAGAVVVAAVVWYRLARSVLGPLAEIQQAAGKLADGHLGHRIGSERGDELGAVARAFDEMAERLQVSQEDLARRASHDSLTGLANRTALQERLQTPRAGTWALLRVDLDGLKAVNDTLGHAAGDELLTAVATRLPRAIERQGLCARLGGTEFALLVPSSTAAAAVEVARRLDQVVRKPVTLAGRDVAVDPCIGIVADVRLGEHVDPGGLLRDADLAAYAARRSGGGRPQLFRPELDAEALARREIESELRQALDRAERGQLRSVYQPVIDLATGQVTGVEALVRWQHPRKGVMRPDLFLPLAEESDLIVTLGQQVLEHACREVASWRRLNPDAPPLLLNVNLSARQLQHPDLIEHIETALQRSGIPAGQLTLEIAETTAMADPETNLTRLRQLTACGVNVAIDNFGTGYSSLTYLQQFPTRTLKLDKSFIASLDADPASVSLTGAVLRLGETLGLHVVAQGVERETQAEILRHLGCPAAQGYLFGRPAPLSDLVYCVAETALTA